MWTQEKLTLLQSQIYKHSMKIYNDIEQKTPEWFALRNGKVTGTLLKKIVGTARTQETAYYELLAERLSVVEHDEESALNRGIRLEDEAREYFANEYKVKVDTMAFVESDTNKFMGISPDGFIKKGKKYTQAVEIKCLSSANHVKAWLEHKIPEEYYPQVVQYFIVNKDLQSLFFVLYDPRIEIHPMHVITVERSDIKDDIEGYEKEELAMIKRVNDKVKELLA